MINRERRHSENLNISKSWYLKVNESPKIWILRISRYIEYHKVSKLTLHQKWGHSENHDASNISRFQCERYDENIDTSKISSHRISRDFEKNKSPKIWTLRKHRFIEYFQNRSFALANVETVLELNHWSLTLTTLNFIFKQSLLRIVWAVHQFQIIPR